MPFIPLYFIYFSITSFPLLSICSLYSGNWYNTQEEVYSITNSALYKQTHLPFNLM
ncbi:hypothetical protein [Wolbachia endosymbiont (group B) of Hofmannophila pseudospretella]|uniref:hypothetical protein n=1 Tax=Wolbachia endosymbiont (group B) of Hofmannophila pseudospretella TaxID=3066177 RepID=UPI0039785DA3